MTNVPSGWYPNPHNPGEEMYWDGMSWSGAARKLSASRIEEATMVRADASAVAQQTAAPESARQPAGGIAAVGAIVEETLEPIEDERPFGEAGWPEPAPEPAPGPREASRVNWPGTVALILGCCGALLTLGPFFVWLVAGGILNLWAVGFCVFGVLRGRKLGGKGVVLSLIGGVLGALGFIAMAAGVL
jgi:hypothetical protein